MPVIATATSASLLASAPCAMLQATAIDTAPNVTKPAPKTSDDPGISVNAAATSPPVQLSASATVRPAARFASTTRRAASISSAGSRLSIIAPPNTAAAQGRYDDPRGVLRGKGGELRHEAIDRPAIGGVDPADEQRRQCRRQQRPGEFGLQQRIDHRIGQFDDRGTGIGPRPIRGGLVARQKVAVRPPDQTGRWQARRTDDAGLLDDIGQGDQRHRLRLGRGDAAALRFGRRGREQGCDGEQRGLHRGRLTVATACAAMPSPRPVKPSRSVVVALMLTRSSDSPSSAPMRVRMASRCGPIFGASQISVRSTKSMRPPLSAIRVAACCRNCAESAPFHCGSLGGKCVPMSPAAIVPSSASPMNIEAGRAPRLPGDFGFGRGEVLRMRHFVEHRIALHQSDAPAKPLHHLRIVGGLFIGGPAGMGGAERGQAKALRRLHTEQPVARDDRTVAHERVRNGEAGDRPLIGIERGQYPVDHLRRHEGPCRIVDQHPVGLDRCKPARDRLAPRRSADDRAHRPECGGRQRLRPRGNHHHHLVHRRVPGKGGISVREQSLAADVGILFRDGTAGARAAARRHDQRDRPLLVYHRRRLAQTRNACQSGHRTVRAACFSGRFMAHLTPIQIGPIRIEQPVVLAPMTGVTDMPFRTLVRRYGSGLNVTEMIASQAAIRETRQSLQKAAWHLSEEPVSMQLVGCTPLQ
ncbi:hypothetical protein WR25_01718 [Diploscapter pachys]|uniref:tRNA-dihydrouridine(47) synthase [NAD(P)(+)] n=1 Tax=Diploscapter pachys TaxID=2018661 RepID=A0A2A2K0C5_9BILA|nr:hypothetical protein WR25_01718 [Diploscapter pachys]